MSYIKMRSLRAYTVVDAKRYCYINRVIRSVDDRDIGGMREVLITMASYIDEVHVYARNRKLCILAYYEQYILYYLHDKKLEWRNGKIVFSYV